MTPQQIVGMAVRLFAIWLVLMSLQMYNIAVVLHHELGGLQFLKYALPLPTLGAAILLWIFPMLIAHLLVPRTNQNNVLTLPVRDAVAAAAAILGLWALINSIPTLVSTLAVLVFQGKEGVFETRVTASALLFTGKFITTVVQCMIGLYLMARPWRVAARIFPQSNQE